MVVEVVKEGKVKEEVEAHIVEEKVEVTDVLWVRTFWGSWAAGAIIYLP